MRLAAFLVFVAIGNGIQGYDSCQYILLDETGVPGTCLPVGSPEIENKYVCKGFYMTNICPDPSVSRCSSWDDSDRDCLLHQQTM